MTKTILNTAGQTYGSTGRSIGGDNTYLWLITVSKPITIDRLGLVPSVIDSTLQKVFPVIYNTVSKALIAKGEQNSKNLVAYSENVLPLNENAYLVPGITYAVGFYVSHTGYTPSFYAQNASVLAGGFSYTDSDGVLIQNAAQAVQTAGRPTVYPSTGLISIGNPPVFALFYEPTNYNPEVSINDAGGEKTSTFSVPYTLNDFEGTLMSVAIKLNGVTLTTLSNQSNGAKTYSLPAATFNALPYGHKQTLIIEATDAGGKKGIGTLIFKRMLPANPPLVESVKAVNDGYSRMQGFKNELSTFAEMPAEATLDDILEAIKNNTDKKWAAGSVYVGMKNFPDGLMNVRGLDFTPSIILIKEAGGASFANSYVYVKLYKTAATTSNYLFGSSTGRMAFITPILFTDGFYFGPDAGNAHDNFFDWMGLKTLEYIAIE